MTNKDLTHMNISKYIAIAALLLALAAAGAQNQPTIPQRALVIPATQKSGEETLTRFSLDFPGGTPKQLVAAIQKAMGKPLNAIVPTEFADTSLPELKMNNVNVRELFSALEATSRRSEA